jgi:zinc dependent phospholipase C
MKVIATLFVVGALVAVPSEARAYSALSHEANIDALWDTGIRPLLAKRFPRATPEELLKVRAYAYGGSAIQDLGYFPFGSRFFSNLLHYVRTGDLVEAMIHEASDLPEYAFALGALAHYAADNVGHPEAVNRSVALMYPKLRARYGNSVTYGDAPATHVLVEFSFDVVQVATARYKSEEYRSFIGFEVAKPVLERAFLATYGLEMKDVFLDEDRSIGSYRYAISQMLPQITRIAWRDKRDEIAKALPGITQQQFVYRLTRQEFERTYGTKYRKPGLLARFLAFLYKVLPKVGPLSVLQFKAPTPQAEALFLESINDTRSRYRAALDSVGAGRINLANTDFDTGKPSAHGEYALADDTYAELLHRLSNRKFAGVPDDLRNNILAFYAAAANRTASSKERKRLDRIREELAALAGTNTTETKDTKDTKGKKPEPGIS